ncbi:MAG: hypothetical protein AAB553_04835 [Patescibacteria group bacterium]
MTFNFKNMTLGLAFSNEKITKVKKIFEKKTVLLLLLALSGISIAAFVYYYVNGLGLAYNDARSHLDIGRRVVENLKPGFAQLGSVWLPLPHLLMTPTIWNDFMWHSGLSGALQSMISYVATAMLIYFFLRQLGVGMFGRIAGLAVFALNINVLYMQSTAMTELLLLATMTAGVYELLMWHREETIFRLIKAAFWIMLSTLIRYDGWFLFAFAAGLIFLRTIRRRGYKATEGMLVLFCTLGGFGVFLWLLWNQLIFKDMLYFAFGPYSANAQQSILDGAGILATKKDIWLSFKTYVYAMVYNAGLLQVILAVIGVILLWKDKHIEPQIRIATTALLAPFFFNILALYLGHSVLFVQGLAGDSWFNVRYGLMMIPSIAIFIGFLLHKTHALRYAIVGLLLFVSFFTFANREAVTIDDARVGASGKNVTEVSNWLKDHAAETPGFVLISAASHDAIIFSSDMPMSKFIHEGAGKYWDLATAHPDRWARWIILRTYDENDLTYRTLRYNKAFNDKYTLVHSFPFADIYEIKPQYVKYLRTEPVPGLEH